MNGLREIRAMNNNPAPKAVDYRVQRDKLAKALRLVIAKEAGAVEAATKLLTEMGLEH